MRLSFYCSCLEPGRDGVGDYTRRLSGELIRQGHACTAVALNDWSISTLVSEPQVVEETTIPVLRLPGNMPWAQRIEASRQWSASFHPDWTSLQFVPFGFHAKGLCFGLGKHLAALNTGAPWHVMFHELWLGLGAQASAKDRAWGFLQRLAVTDLLKRLQPRLVHTQADPYQTVLGREGIQVQLLPLFSNIPQTSENGWDDVLAPQLAAATGTPPVRGDLYLAGVLGAVHREWNPELAVDCVLPLAQHFKKKLVLVLLGKNNLAPEILGQLKTRLRNRAMVFSVGERPSREISKVLNSLDLGLATSPRQIIQKSGSAAAMLEHGLTVLVTRDDWRLRWPAPMPSNPRVLSPEQFAALKQLPVRNPDTSVENNVRTVAHQLITGMNSHVAMNPEDGTTKHAKPGEAGRVTPVRAVTFI